MKCLRLLANQISKLRSDRVDDRLIVAIGITTVLRLCETEPCDGNAAEPVFGVGFEKDIFTFRVMFDRRQNLILFDAEVSQFCFARCGRGRSSAGADTDYRDIIFRFRFGRRSGEVGSDICNHLSALLDCVFDERHTGNIADYVTAGNICLKACAVPRRCR